MCGVASVCCGQMAANWGLYIAIIGAVLAVAGCVLLWIEGLMVCKTVGKIRYQQLRQKRDLYEHERDPNDFIYSPSARSGAPPVVGYPGGPILHGAPRQTYRPPPSVSGSSMHSGSAYISREVDL